MIPLQTSLMQSLCPQKHQPAFYGGETCDVFRACCIGMKYLVCSLLRSSSGFNVISESSCLSMSSFDGGFVRLLHALAILQVLAQGLNLLGQNL